MSGSVEFGGVRLYVELSASSNVCLMDSSSNHYMFDSIGAMEFVNYLVETASGLPLSVPPFIDQIILRLCNPHVISFPHYEFDKIKDISDSTALYQEELLYRSFHLDDAKLEHIKEHAALMCTTFKALSGLVWRSRTKAPWLMPGKQTKFLFKIDSTITT